VKFCHIQPGLTGQDWELLAPKEIKDPEELGFRGMVGILIEDVSAMWMFRQHVLCTKCVSPPAR